MRYQWILFDADNTLFDFDRSEQQALDKTLEEHSVLSNPAVRAIYNEVNKQCWLAFENGELPKNLLRTRRFELFFEAIKVKIEPQAFSARYLQNLSDTDDLINGARELLDQLMGKVKMGMVTNGLKEVQRPRISKAGITDYFEVIVVSDEIGFAKPQAAFFDYAFRQMGEPPREKVIMVGDNLNSDIRGGKDYGLDTCWYNYYGQPKTEPVEPTYEIDSLAHLADLLR